jgi:hypothetical protein
MPKDRSNPNSYKVRRGKAGGYRDDFDAAQLRQIDRLVDATLDPLYGYAEAAGPAAIEPALSRVAAGGAP